VYSAINLQQDLCSIFQHTLSMSLHYIAKFLLLDIFDFHKLLMMFMGMSKFRKMNLILVDPGVKINGTCCRDVLLT